MKNISFSRKFSGIKYRLFDIFKENRKTTLLLVIVAVIGLFTGIFCAIKYSNGATLINFNDFSLSSYLNGNLGSSDLFYSRLLSTTIVSGIIFVSSFHFLLAPVSFFVLIYRAYLLSLNATMIIIFNGISGIVCCLLIVIPCQIISLILILLFASYSLRYSYLKKHYGLCNEFKIWHKFLIFLFLLLIVNMIETFLLYIFSSRIILVI